QRRSPQPVGDAMTSPTLGSAALHDPTTWSQGVASRQGRPRRLPAAAPRARPGRPAAVTGHASPPRGASPNQPPQRPRGASRRNRVPYATEQLSELPQASPTAGGSDYLRRLRRSSLALVLA